VITINNIITTINKKHNHIWNGRKVEEIGSDKILYGDANQKCTGIVVTCWASIGVIKEAIKLGANLIIAHEAMFYNHGDHTDWLKDNNTFNIKKQLLDSYNICVYRDHDYIHAGIPYKDGYIDGIYYGITKELGWEKYLTEVSDLSFVFDITETSGTSIAKLWIEKFGLNGIKIIGNPNSTIKKVWLAGHIMGNNIEQINFIEKNNIDMIIPLEIIDYTLSEYIKDSSDANLNKVVLAIGHFNTEEPGMKYFAEILKEWLPNITINFISSDMYTFITKNT
jgi:Uncharacterized conserved protein